MINIFDIRTRLNNVCKEDTSENKSYISKELDLNTSVDYIWTNTNIRDKADASEIKGLWEQMNIPNKYYVGYDHYRDSTTPPIVPSVLIKRTGDMKVSVGSANNAQIRGGAYTPEEQREFQKLMGEPLQNENLVYKGRRQGGRRNISPLL